MKSKILLLIISLFLSFFSSNSIFSEEDNLNIPPKALPLSPIRISSYQTFKLENGLTVFLIEDHKLPTVSFVLYFDFLTKIKKTKYGLGELTTRLMKEGAGKRSKQQLDEELDFMGTDLVIQNNLIYASGLEKYSKESLEILSDIVKSPAFDKNEFQKIKEEIIAEIKSNKLDPNSEANNLMKTLLYPENHPYREIPSEESMQNIKIEDCKAYHNKFFKPGNSYLAIIGDISFATIEDKDWVA
ncbi:MAG TPA: insulinase family protein, partial [Leptospiraceae bacterium]|nr:insulinase family protein [Leptospiraceae bacterium]